MILVYGHYADGNTALQVPLNAKGYSITGKETKYCGAENVQFETAAWNWNSVTEKYDLPDMSKISYNCESRGINVRYTINCDYTQLITDNIHLFAKPLQMQIAIKMFMDGITGNEMNSVTESRREIWRQLLLKLQGELYGYTSESKAQVKGYFENIDFDLSNIDNICVPCQKRGVEFHYMGY